MFAVSLVIFDGVRVRPAVLPYFLRHFFDPSVEDFVLQISQYHCGEALEDISYKKLSSR
jgi:hypothetical protein